MWSAGPRTAPPALVAAALLAAASAFSLAACAAQRGDSGIRIVHHTPKQFCEGTARSIALDRYAMKKEGVPLNKAMDRDSGVAVIDAITKAIYGQDLKSEREAADAGTAACLSHFR